MKLMDIIQNSLPNTFQKMILNQRLMPLQKLALKEKEKNWEQKKERRKDDKKGDKKDGKKGKRKEEEKPNQGEEEDDIGFGDIFG